MEPIMLTIITLICTVKDQNTKNSLAFYPSYFDSSKSAFGLYNQAVPP